MWKDVVITLMLLGLGQVLSQHRKRQSHPVSLLGILTWRDLDTELTSQSVEPEIYTPSSENFFWGLRWASNPELLTGTVIGKRIPTINKSGSLKLISKRLRKVIRASDYVTNNIVKRQDYNCDITRITIQTIIEYLRTGRICGFRVSTMRFGLGRRR